MEFYYLTTKYRETEKFIHYRFDSLHEWVKADLESIIKEIKKIGGVLENPENWREGSISLSASDKKKFTKEQVEFLEELNKESEE
jgi:hypothetical protein